MNIHGGILEAITWVGHNLGGSCYIAHGASVGFSGNGNYGNACGADYRCC